MDYFLGFIAAIIIAAGVWACTAGVFSIADGVCHEAKWQGIDSYACSVEDFLRPIVFLKRN